MDFRRRARRNVLVLAICQMVYTSGRTLFIATAPLIAYTIAAHKGLATLPASLVIVGTALATMPASLVMQRMGRRFGFVGGSLIGAAGAGLCAWGLAAADFWLFCAGALLYGLYSGSAQLYRYAAADVAPTDFRAKAISLVLAGGVVAAFVGPELAKAGVSLIRSTEFLGAYLIFIVTCLLSGLIVAFVDIPKPARGPASGARRPLLAIMRQPAFVVATLTALVGQSVMSLIMTATPIAMALQHHSFSDTALVIEWHIVGMFAPGFVTGSLIRRFGVLTISLAGLALLMAAVAAALTGEAVLNYWISMALLGVGWNFAFTSGATLLTEVHSPAERGATQGANTFLIYGCVAVASLSSGGLLHYFGWRWVSLGAVPLIFIAFTATLWLLWLRRNELPGSTDVPEWGKET